MRERERGSFSDGSTAAPSPITARPSPERGSRRPSGRISTEKGLIENESLHYSISISTRLGISGIITG